MTLQQLKRKLERNGISTASMGNVCTYRMRRCLESINAGETSLIPSDGKAIRVVEAVVVVIKKKLNEDLDQILIERQRKHTNGRIIHCTKRDGIGKKIKHGENALLAAKRCIREKLGLRIMPELTYMGKDIQLSEDNSPLPSPLLKTYRHFYSCTIPEEEYDPNGYVRLQPDGHTTHFFWLPVMRAGTELTVHRYPICSD